MPRHSPAVAAPNSMSKRGIWETSDLRASFRPALACLAGSGAWSRGPLKLISNKTQPPGSHPSQGERACDILGAAPGKSGRSLGRPEAVRPTAPCPKGLPGGTDYGLVRAKSSCQASFGVSFTSILGPEGSVSLSPQLSLARTPPRPARTLEAARGWGD